ncbi:hypothetical protein [Micromonospora zingiberis]|uniref:hypothetical protein n=1 Tax=Micromonospora zingiberis TaxID=2053011 RepID=UPI0013F402C3|nr:hypothetical protein [Micromonospora zingiberis]
MSQPSRTPPVPRHARPPESIEVGDGGYSYRVVPLVRVESTEPGAAELLRRYRSRATG